MKQYIIIILIVIALISSYLFCDRVTYSSNEKRDDYIECVNNNGNKYNTCNTIYNLIK